jgi:cellulase/cellobiase CelA1
VTNQWPGGFQAAVTVTNTGTNTTTGWRVTWTFANGQTISQLWGGVFTQSGGSVTVQNEAWNGALAPNTNTSIGFLASWNGTNSTPRLSCTRTP